MPSGGVATSTVEYIQPTVVKQNVKTGDKVYTYKYKIIRIRVPEDTKIVKLKRIDEKRILIEFD